MAERDNHAAPEHRPALADDAVREPAARQAEQIDHRGVEAVDRAGFRRRKAEAAVRHGRRHEEDEQGAHAVVAEALPHFGEEERGEAAGMAEERAVPARVGGVGRCCRHSATFSQVRALHWLLLRYVITDLVQIKQLGEKKQVENEKFRRYLKRHNFPELKFRRVAEEIESQIDCRACANCCKVAETDVTERDIAGCRDIWAFRRSEFVEQYTTASAFEQKEPILRRRETGCIFLDGNDCTIYEARPDTCRDFPHLMRGRGIVREPHVADGGPGDLLPDRLQFARRIQGHGQISKVNIGIDFGTTNRFRSPSQPFPGRWNSRDFPWAGCGRDAYRWLLYLEQITHLNRKTVKSWTGPEGIEHYLMAENKGRLIQSLKSFLASRSLKSTDVFGRRTKLEDLIARILRDLREKAGRQFGVEIRSAVVGRPVHLSAWKMRPGTSTLRPGSARRSALPGSNPFNSRWSR